MDDLYIFLTVSWLAGNMVILMNNLTFFYLIGRRKPEIWLERENKGVFWKIYSAFLWVVLFPGKYTCYLIDSAYQEQILPLKEERNEVELNDGR